MAVSCQKQRVIFSGSGLEGSLVGKARAAFEKATTWAAEVTARACRALPAPLACLVSAVGAPVLEGTQPGDSENGVCL